MPPADPMQPLGHTPRLTILEHSVHLEQSVHLLQLSQPKEDHPLGPAMVLMEDQIGLAGLIVILLALATTVQLP